MSVFLEVILKLLSFITAGITLYVVYKTRSGSLASPFAGIAAFVSWEYFIAGLLFALVLFSLGHIFTMLISVFDRQELAVQRVLTSTALARPPDHRGASFEASGQRGDGLTEGPTTVERSDESSQVPLHQEPDPVIRSSSALEAQAPAWETATQMAPETPAHGRSGLWGALTRERHLFKKGD